MMTMIIPGHYKMAFLCEQGSLKKIGGGVLAVNLLFMEFA
jgi:hypothetical protein